MFEVTTNKRSQQEACVVVGFLLIPFLIASSPSLSFSSYLSDRSSREACVGGGRLHRLAMSQRDHKTLALAALVAEALQPMSLATKSAPLPAAVPCAPWAASVSSPRGVREGASAALGASPPAEAREVSLSGWFTIIWNDRTRYFLTDDQGRWTELLLDEELAKPFGGLLALNRKRVTIVGEKVDEPSGAIRVVSIALE